MADVSQLTSTDGITYNIKDAEARTAIANLQLHDYLGDTTTAITDGATTNPITIDGNSVTATKGATVTYGNKEFLWTGSKWVELGDLSDLGSLAFKNSATGSYTPTGQIVGGGITGGNAEPTATKSCYSITGLGTLPTAVVASGSENMVFTAGSLPTRSNVTGLTAGITYTAPTYTAPTFQGSAGQITVQ